MRSSVVALVTLVTLVGACSPDTGGAPDGFPDLPALEAVIESEMREAHLPGFAGCIIKEGAIRWCRGLGWAHIEDRIAVTVDTPFLLASVSKLAAAAAIMHALERGHVDLDEPVAPRLPFPVVHPDFADDPITMRMLLTHQSGIVDNWDVLEQLYTVGDPDFSLGDFLRDYLGEGGAHFDARRNFGGRPGTVWEYSNIGVALAAHMVERAARMDFAGYCAANVFAPLALEHTAWRLGDLREGMAPAMPYEWLGDDFAATGQYGFPDYPSGQLRSSARDLAGLFAMLAGGGASGGARILEPATVEEMKRLQIPGNDEQALVWYFSILDGQELLGHDGGELGAAAEVQHRTSDDVGVVLMMNGEGRATTAERIMRAMFAAADTL
jgi:CubicO group peptidase (beta-lactamase class C family)